MNLEQAIQTAIQFEKKVSALYVEAAAAAGDKQSKQFYQLMANEELHHLGYLHNRLTEWKSSSRVNVETLKTAVPGPKAIAAAVAKLTKLGSDAGHRDDLDRLRKALDLETETSQFYARAVSELPKADQALFKRFLEIEDGHKAIVQAEINALSGSGYWFDVQEIDLEGG